MSEAAASPLLIVPAVVTASASTATAAASAAADATAAFLAANPLLDASETERCDRSRWCDRCAPSAECAALLAPSDDESGPTALLARDAFAAVAGLSAAAWPASAGGDDGTACATAARNATAVEEFVRGYDFYAHSLPPTSRR